MRSCRSNNRAISPLLAGIVALLPVAGNQAQTSDTSSVLSESPERLETLDVIVSDHYQTGDVFTDELTGGATRIPQQTLESSSNSLAQIVAQETGVQFRQSGGFGSYSSISIRAASAAQTGIHLDGILLNTGGSPIIDLSTLNMLNLGSVDIYRGSTPLQLGHGSIGGAVNLNTRNSSREPAAGIRLETGSYSRLGIQLTHQGEHKYWDTLTAISSRRSSNNFWFSNNNGTPLNPSDDVEEQRHNTQVERTSALFRLGYEKNKNRRTDLVLQLSDRLIGVPEWRNRADNDASYDTRTVQTHLSQRIDQLGSWNSKHTLYWHLDNARFRDEFGQIGLTRDDVANTSYTLGAKSFWERPDNNGTLGLLMDYRQENFDLENQLYTAGSYSAKRSGLLGTVHYTWLDANEQWTVTPAVRLQQIRNSSSQVSSELQSSHLQTGGQLGIGYSISKNLRLTSNTGTYYREPSFNELYGSSGLINGNESLKPEKGINADLGLSYTGSNWTLNGSVFASTRDEMIVIVYDSRGVGRSVNTGKARVLGMELSMDAKLTKQMNLRSNLTWQDPRNKNREAGFHDKALPGEAKLVWFSRVEYQYENTSFWYELNSRKDRFYDRANILKAADTHEQSIGMDWRYKNWQSSFALHNIGNTVIEDFNGFAKPGRHWTFSIRHNF